MKKLNVHNILGSYCFVSCQDASDLARYVLKIRNEFNSDIQLDFSTIDVIIPEMFNYFWKAIYNSENNKVVYISLNGTDQHTSVEFLKYNDQQYKNVCDMKKFYEEHPEWKSNTN